MCYQTSQRNWVIIKVVSPKVLVGLAYFEIRICHSDCRRGISGPLGNAHHLSLASIATNELVAG